MTNKLGRFINKSFKRRIICFLTPLIIIAVFFAAYISYYQFFNKIKEEKNASTEVLVNQIGENIDYYFNDMKTIITYFSANKDILYEFENHDKMTIDQRIKLKYKISDYVQNVNIYKDYISDILFIGINGYKSNLPNYYTLTSQKSLLEEEWIKPYLKVSTRKFYFTPSHESNYYDGSNQTPTVVSTLLPIIENKKTIGFIVGNMNYNKMNVLIDMKYRQKDMNISMVDQSGLIIFDSDSRLINDKIDKRILDEISKRKIGSITYTSNGKDFLKVYRRSDVTGWYVVATIPYSVILKPAYDIFNNIMVLLPIILIMSFFITIKISSNIERPLLMLVNRIENVNIEDYKSEELDYGVMEINNLALTFESMLSKINNLIQQVYIAEINKKNAELESLRSQIAPHFIYNALQLIKTEAVLSKNEEISVIVTSIGNLLRYAMENKKSVVTIREEIRYIESYLEIYSRRFGDRLLYEVKIDKNLENIKIQKMILQPIIENCIKHAFLSKKTDNRISIKGFGDDKEIIIIIRDNGKGIDNETIARIRSQINDYSGNSKNIGLANIHQRIVLLFGEGYGIVKIDSVPGEYTEITLRMRGSIDYV